MTQTRLESPGLNSLNLFTAKFENSKTMSYVYMHIISLLKAEVNGSTITGTFNTDITTSAATVVVVVVVD